VLGEHSSCFLLLSILGDLNGILDEKRHLKVHMIAKVESPEADKYR